MTNDTTHQMILDVIKRANKKSDKLPIDLRRSLEAYFNPEEVPKTLGSVFDD